MFTSARQEKNPTQTKLVNRMIKTGQALLRVIEDENKLLETGQVRSIESIVQKKVDFLNEFNQVQLELAEYELISQLKKDDVDLHKLGILLEKIDAENRKNELLLRVNIEVSEKVVRLYKQGQTRNAISKAGYNKEGKMVSSKSIEKTMPAISLNNKV